MAWVLSALEVLSPAPTAPAQARAGSVCPRMVWHDGVCGVSAYLSWPQTYKRSMCRGFSSLCKPGLRGDPIPFTPDPDRVQTPRRAMAQAASLALADENSEARRGAQEAVGTITGREDGWVDGWQRGAGARRPDAGAGYSEPVCCGKGGSLQSPPSSLACEP